MNSYNIVAEAVRDFWKNKNYHFAEPVVAFFSQKHDYDTKWEELAVFVDCETESNCDSVVFETDFCEGENCVKDLHIVTFEYVADYYRNNMLKR